MGIETYDLRKVFQPRTGLFKRGGSPTVAVDGLTLRVVPADGSAEGASS